MIQNAQWKVYQILLILLSSCAMRTTNIIMHIKCTGDIYKKIIILKSNALGVICSTSVSLSQFLNCRNFRMTTIYNFNCSIFDASSTPCSTYE